jgi:serine/threonine protein kinase
MVQIFGGGVDKNTNNHYIVMEYLDGPSLQKCLLDVPESNIPNLIQQLASCCEYLEQRDLAHRDIKPANIVLTNNYDRLVLLDFGVLKPVGDIGLTDAGGIQSFIGTLQYSSPEFLLRKEEDSTLGWRALSLYQIGGVLHDLIMRRPLFEEYTNPYARLVNAVQHDVPNINNTLAPSYLITACRASLVKDPNLRVRLVSWNSFCPPVEAKAGLAAKERVTNRSLMTQAGTAPVPTPTPPATDLIEAAVNLLKIEARRIRNEDTTALPPLSFFRVPRSSPIVAICFRSSGSQGLPQGLKLFFKIEVINSNADVIEIGAAAWPAAETLEIPDNSYHSIFQGILDPSGIATALTNTIYVAVDCAQQRQESDIYNWLDLENSKEMT